MNAKLILPAVATALMLGPAMPALAEVHEFSVDPVHSRIGFQVRHLVAKVPGGFGEFDGMISADPDDLAGTLKVRGTVKTASVDTGNEQRDGHLRSPDFFDAENHPEMTLVSKSVRKDGSKLTLLTDLTIRGVTKEVPFRVEWGGVMANPFTGTPTAGLELTGEVNRKDYGILWNKALDAGGFVLGDDVKIIVQLEATVPPPATEKS